MVGKMEKLVEVLSQEKEVERIKKLKFFKEKFPDTPVGRTLRQQSQMKERSIEQSKSRNVDINSPDYGKTGIVR
jgi:hypothetical protein